MLPFIIIRFEGFKIYRYSSEGLERRKKLSVGMKLCLILFTSQQMTVFSSSISLSENWKFAEKHPEDGNIWSCREMTNVCSLRCQCDDITIFCGDHSKNVQNPISHLPQVIAHTRVWSWSRHHNNLVIQPDQHTMGSASMAARTLAYSAISPITVQASYQAACTDRA